MCATRDLVFRLKDAFSGPHSVDIKLTKNGRCVEVMISNDQMHRRVFLPLNAGEKGCEDCTEIVKEKPVILKEIFGKGEMGA